MSPASLNPFPGLRPFEPHEDYLFFGRERAVDELIRRLRTDRFLAIVGSSGSGKSSLVRSGLIPALHGGLMVGAGSAWRVAVTRPGSDPLGNLAAALNEPDVLGPEDQALTAINRQLLETTLRSSALGLADAVRQASLPERDRVLVVVDQFEEIFRFRRHRAGGSARHDAKAFVRILLAAALLDDPVPIYVALTMRSDFIGDCMEFPQLPRQMNEGLYLVPRLARDELRQAITGPVAVGRGEIAARLVRRLLNEFGDDPDQLPILQHALMRTWDSWRSGAADKPLDLEDYEAVGGMREALSRHAEEAWSELSEGRKRQIAERLFRLLTDRTMDERGVRRPCRLREICDVAEASQEEVTRVVDRFREPGRSLLMPPTGVELGPDSIIDISHESLMRVWGRLESWALEEAEAASFYLRLTLAALHYEEGTAGLWREAELRRARRWQDQARPTEGWSRRYNDAWQQATAFLDESRTVRERWLASQRRKRRFRRWLAVGSVMLLLAAVAIWQTLEVRKAHRLAAEREAAMRANRVLAAAVNAPEPRIQALILGELDEAVEPPGGVRVAREVARSVGDDEPRLLGIHEGEVIGASFVGDSPRVITAFADGSAAVWNPGKPAPPVLLRGHEGLVVSGATSPDGTRIATASLDGTAAVWPSDGGAPVVLSGHQGGVTSVAFGPAGRRVVTAAEDGTVRIWDADGTGEPLVLRSPQGNPISAAFDPAGQRVVTGAADGSVRVWRADGVAEPLLLGRHWDAVPTVAFSHDGSRVVTASDDGTAQIWPANGLGEPIVLRQRGEFLISAAFSHDDREILTTSGDGAVRIWNADGSGNPILLGSHGSKVAAAAFHPNDATVITAANDGNTLHWRTRWAELLDYLRSVSEGCLTTAQRIQYLEEIADEAAARFRDCEPREED